MTYRKPTKGNVALVITVKKFDILIINQNRDTNKNLRPKSRTVYETH